jgi:hypothetical protein
MLLIQDLKYGISKNNPYKSDIFVYDWYGLYTLGECQLRDMWLVGMDVNVRNSINHKVAHEGSRLG